MSNVLVAIELTDLLDLDILHRSRTHRPDGGTARSRIRNVYPYIWTNPRNPFSRQKPAEALIETLDDGHLFGAGVDVFDGEPKVNPALVAYPRVVYVPHLGSATRHTRPTMANLAARNVVLAGDTPITPVPR